MYNYNDLNMMVQKPSSKCPIDDLLSPVIMVLTVGIGMLSAVVWNMKSKNKALKTENKALNFEIELLEAEEEYEEESDVELYDQPSEPTVEPLEGAVEETVEQSLGEEDEKERLREVMSMLGKRSAAARAKKQ